MIRDRNVLIMIDAIASGQTAKRAIECIEYYGGIIAGIAAIFSAYDELDGFRISHLFGKADLPDYQVTDYHDCPQCKAGVRLDALANTTNLQLLSPENECSEA